MAPCGFAGYLRLKEAYALVRGDAGQAGIAADALGKFLDGHLRVLAGPLSRRLAAAAPSYLVRAAASLVERAGDAPNPSWAPDPSQRDDPGSMECGLAPDGGMGMRRIDDTLGG